MRNPPLALYVHIPWCVQKCPYCDFNSHAQKAPIPEMEYVKHLLADLALDAKQVEGRQVNSIFIGGGTPSIFSVNAINALLHGITERVALSDDVEITLEANPGTIESEKFIGFYQAGINRLSIGVQSFQQDKLTKLGRIHDTKQAKAAAGYARNAGINNFNLDIMHGLPQQNINDALYDLDTAIAQQPPHLSWYQLTIEPNTQFYSRPPSLPEDDTLWDIQQLGHQRLTNAGYQQYEISGYAQAGHQCRHNLNYWRFGDYLGIGCGAHGKITQADQGIVSRTVKSKHPRGYMDISRPYLDTQTQVLQEDLPFEFFMNRFRLLEPCPKQDYQQLTGLSMDNQLADKLKQATDKGLISDNRTHWQVTPLGRRYLNSLLETLI